MLFPDRWLLPIVGCTDTVRARTRYACVGHPRTRARYRHLSSSSDPSPANAATSSMTSQTERERQCVYLTYRDLFCGSKARVRNRKIIRKIVLKHSSQSGNDVHEQHLGRTINILNTLLKDRVFEFERTARRTFPDLFAKSLPVPHTVTSSTEQDIMAERPTKTKQWHKDKREGLARYPSNGMLPAFPAM
jgi:hypothetical protein